MKDQKKIVVRGGQVYDHDGDVHKPQIADILIEDGEIVAVGPDLEADGAEIVDARDRLVVPGLINAHYHSHDTLCRGLFEELPLEFWLLYTLPMGANAARRRCARARWSARWNRMRCGITCVQDMLGSSPLDDASTDVVITAYRDIGLRVVFSPMVWDVPPIAMVRHKDELAARRAGDARHRRPPDHATSSTISSINSTVILPPARCTGRVAPFAPQRCTPKMLQGCAELAHKHDLPVYTHVYETRGQAADRARAVCRAWRLADHISREQRPARAEAQHRAQRLDLARRRWTAWRRRTPASCSTT